MGHFEQHEAGRGWLGPPPSKAASGQSGRLQAPGEDLQPASKSCVTFAKPLLEVTECHSSHSLLVISKSPSCPDAGRGLWTPHRSGRCVQGTLRRGL